MSGLTDAAGRRVVGSGGGTANVVFDVGGVIIDWRPETVLHQTIEDPSERERLVGGLVAHPDWLELDKGAITLDQFCARSADRTGLSESRIGEVLDSLKRSLVPIGETVDLIRRLRHRGHRVFVLSNMPEHTAEYLERTVPIWDLFDGIVFSFRVGLIKPGRAIYEYLLDRYALRADDTIFIDDLEPNVAAAAELGITPIRFFSPHDTEARLRTLGCL